MVQISAYFERVQIVWKLESPKIFSQDYKNTWFFLAQQLFIYFGAPDFPVNMVATYHRLDGGRSMQHKSKISN